MSEELINPELSLSSFTISSDDPELITYPNNSCRESFIHNMLDISKVVIESIGNVMLKINKSIFFQNIMLMKVSLVGNL
jgi:hypothetical protein